MKRYILNFYAWLPVTVLVLIVGVQACSGPDKTPDPSRDFQSPPESSKPWVFWYWMHASVSKEGITADLEAMEEAGIGGAYLMPIKGVTDPPLMEPPVEQLSTQWWEMVKHAISEAERLGLKIAMHASDGFALAGGPWITPELSMQKIVWTELHIRGGNRFDDLLTQPGTNEGYYQDITVFAFPTPEGADLSTRNVKPVVTTSEPGVEAQFLVLEGNKKSFRSDESCWIQYTFKEPFTCRSIKIRTNGHNFQSQRLVVQVSDGGKSFRTVERMEPPRHGWQDGDADVTHGIPPTTAKYFRFVYNKEGSEPGAEDLDAAKWRQSLRISGIELSGAPRIHQYEGKTGAVWRISRRTTSSQVPDELCIPPDKILDISENMSADGHLGWDVPEGNWTIVRMGYTSTGHTNETGGAGRGLECDKFNPEAIRVQFDHWFGEATRIAGPELAGKVLKIFHVDSWECGSQNWSPVFRDEFKKRRGYDLYEYLPVMAGIPVQSVDVSERFLYDVRRTVSDLVVDNFYGTLVELAHEKGCSFSAENVAPTFTSDGMLHFGAVDIPMGEFWLRSPTHDKPNDMLDAISGAHIYGKPVIQSEAFTQLRMAWDEHPGMLKALGDRNYALGINRFVFHVFTHNPWINRKPGMTLDGVGLYFQRDQTWWEHGRAWVEYAQRCQALLQLGRPVTDIAVFTGEEVPRRAVLPDRLVSTLPGIFGQEIIENEARRLANAGSPLQEMPTGVMHAANMADPADWIDPLHGYAFDSFNPDALLRLAKVTDGRIELPGGARYELLILPAPRPMSPDTGLMTPEVAARLLELVKTGATLMVSDRPYRSPGLQEYPEDDKKLQRIIDELWAGKNVEKVSTDPGKIVVWNVGKGRVIRCPYSRDSFDALGIEPDFIAVDSAGTRVKQIAWIHRTAPGLDIYFISNQQNIQRMIEVSFRVSGRLPELYDPVTGEMRLAGVWYIEKGRTRLPLQLEPGGSLFVVFQQPTKSKGSKNGTNWMELKTIQSLGGPWQVKFNPEYGGPVEVQEFERLSDWSTNAVFGIRHYSGTAMYSKTFYWNAPADEHPHVWLDLGKVANIAEVKVNGKPCGNAWTYPYRLEITGALQQGENELRIAVANTWANRLIGDHELPEKDRVTWTTAPYRLEGKPLLEAGLLGPVAIKMEDNKQ